MLATHYRPWFIPFLRRPRLWLADFRWSHERGSAIFSHSGQEPKCNDIVPDPLYCRIGVISYRHLARLLCEWELSEGQIWRVRVQLVWSSGSRANLLSRLLDPIVFLSMNNPPQIGSRVRWWDARGKTKHGSVKAINILSDNSHIIVIQVEDGQPPTVTLPIDHVQLAG